MSCVFLNTEIGRSFNDRICVAGQLEKTSTVINNTEHCASENQTEMRSTVFEVDFTDENKTETPEEFEDMCEVYPTDSLSGDSEQMHDAAETVARSSTFETELADKNKEVSDDIYQTPPMSSSTDLLQENTQLHSAMDGIRCEICGRHFQRVHSLALHIKAQRRNDCVQSGSKERSDGRQKYSCKKCSFVSAYAFCLARHMRNWHRSSETLVTPSQ